MNYEERVAQLIAEGMSNSDAQAAADYEELNGAFDNDSQYGVRLFVGECALVMLGV